MLVLGGSSSNTNVLTHTLGKSCVVVDVKVSYNEAET